MDQDSIKTILVNNLFNASTAEEAEAVRKLCAEFGVLEDVVATVKAKKESQDPQERQDYIDKLTANTTNYFLTILADELTHRLSTYLQVEYKTQDQAQETVAQVIQAYQNSLDLDLVVRDITAIMARVQKGDE